jgi:AAA domain
LEPDRAAEHDRRDLARQSSVRLFLKEAVTPQVGQALGERIRKAVNSDHDTGNPTQPYRVAGTVNYPTAKKIERGRVTVPTRLIEFDPEALWTPEDIEQAFPITATGIPFMITGAMKERLRARGYSDDAIANMTPMQAHEILANGPAPGGEPGDVPADTMRVIRDGVPSGADRSHAFWNVLVVLKADGWTVDGIVALLDRYPNGIAAKYRGRLQREVERVFSKIKDRSAPHIDIRQQRPVKISSAEDLQAMTFNPIKYVVPGILVEGVTLLAGKPKIGKSWLLLHAALAVARGGFTLGEIHCKEGDVLYCALEDNERRLQSRMTKLLNASQGWPKRFHYCCELPRLGDGGADHIRNWIMSVPEPRLVVIDTLAMVRALKKIDESNYQSDYLALLELRELANEFGIAIPVSHHLRKQESDDPYDTISGTLGLTGAVDSILVLKRDSYGGYVLHGKGRDLIEVEKAMTFDRDACLWRVEGEAAPIRRSAERTAILDAIDEAGEPVGPNDIAGTTGMKATNVRFLLGKLVKEGVIEKVARGKYRRKM